MLKLSNNEFNFIIMVVCAYGIIVISCIKNYILIRLNNTQYDMYRSIKSVKVLWKALDKKFKVEVISQQVLKSQDGLRQ
jgi:hypothetical protein